MAYRTIPHEGLLVLLAGLITPLHAQYVQQGPKLLGTATGVYAPAVEQGYTVAISADGNTALEGGPNDGSGAGAVWVFTRAGGSWSQQSKLLVPNSSSVGWPNTIGLSGDGNTAIVGCNCQLGEAWVFTRSGATWSLQSTLTSNNTVNAIRDGLGLAVAVSGDGQTAILGAPNGNFVSGVGAVGYALVFTFANGAWTQQGGALAPSDANGGPSFGTAMALSNDGNTAIIGGPFDNAPATAGAAWIFTRSNGTWTQQGNKLVGGSLVGSHDEYQGTAVAISGDGNTAMAGGPYGFGGAWVYTRSNSTWSQQAGPLGGQTYPGGVGLSYLDGSSVGLNSDGNVAIVGGPGNNNALVFERSNGVWTQKQTLVPSDASSTSSRFGYAGAISADTSTAILGGYLDNSSAGAAWVFDAPPASVTASAGTPQSASVGAAFAAGLRATVLNGLGYPAPGITVAFTAPASGPSATFAGSANTATVTTNASGVAAAPALMANNTAGSYNVTASVQGVTAPASFSLTNVAVTTSISIQTNPAGLQFSVDGGAAQTAPQTLSLTSGSHTIAVQANQAGGAGVQYLFTSWSDGGGASHSITVGSSPATFTATFQTQYLLTMLATPAAAGSVTPASGYYNAGTTVPVNATPIPGYAFGNWTGPVANATSASTTVTMSAPEIVTGVFALATFGLGFFPIAPCRLMDTRGGFGGAFGPPTLAAGATRTIFIPSGTCNITSIAQAFALNVTVVPKVGLTYLTIWPAGQPQPGVSTLNSLNGAVVANAAIVPAGAAGGISVFVSDASDVIIDINGYFATPNTAALAFYSATPCRIVDTRNPTGAFGGPMLSAAQTRSFAVPASACNIPSNAQAYSLNVTVVPPFGLGYLTIWPAGQPQPGVSTLNSLDGRIVANAAIVPAGSSGAIDVFVSDASHVVVDINGYFAPIGGPGALYFYPATPCRIADTRSGSGLTGGYGPPALGAGSTRTFAVSAAGCFIPSTAQAYSLNMTVVPPGPLNYLTTWPAGQTQPVVSTLNDGTGQIVANAAIVPVGGAGSISVFVSDATNLIIDINGYFGQ